MATFALSEALLGVLKPQSRRGSAAARRWTLSAAYRLDGGDEEKRSARSRRRCRALVLAWLPDRRAAGRWGDDRQLPRLWHGAATRRGQERARSSVKGSVRGLAAPESANNAAATGSFVPLLTLGIPGSGTTAIMLGALLAYGIQPGPRLYLDRAGRLLVRHPLHVDRQCDPADPQPAADPLYRPRAGDPGADLLLPLIFFFSLIGVYFVSFNSFDIHMMVLFATAAVGLRLLDFPMAPMILGFILGGMMEDNLRRALSINNGSWSFLWERELTLTILLIAAATLIIPLIAPTLGRRFARRRGAAKDA